MVTYLFPELFSLRQGTGRQLFKDEPELLKQADSILGYSVQELCLENPGNELSQALYVQPILFVLNALSYRKRLRLTGQRPDFLAGYGTGEYNALSAAGVFDFAAGLTMVNYRARLMSRTSPGGMAAVIGLTGEQAEKVLSRHMLFPLQTACCNTPLQTVISGPEAVLLEARTFFEKAGARPYIMLDSPLACYSDYMMGAREEFSRFLSGKTFKEPEIPVISTVETGPCSGGNCKELLVKQLTAPVLWTQAVRYLEKKDPQMEYVEIGPAGPLGSFISQIKKIGNPVNWTPRFKNSKNGSPGKKKIQNEENRGPGTYESNTNKKPPLPGGAESQPGQPKAEIKKQLPNRTGCSLGSASFKKRYGLDYAYLIGGMFKGISSAAMVIEAARSGMLAFYGARDVPLKILKQQLGEIKAGVPGGRCFGVSLFHNPFDIRAEEQIIDLLISEDIRCISLSGCFDVFPHILRYRIAGLYRDKEGVIKNRHKVIVKISHPAIMELFLQPPSEKQIRELLDRQLITAEQAGLARNIGGGIRGGIREGIGEGMGIGIADDFCVTGEAAARTGQESGFTLLPALKRIKEKVCPAYPGAREVHIGYAGGIGTPEAAMTAFLLGADFILTGTINQCTLEARTGGTAKRLLQNAGVQDTGPAPSFELFETGGRIRVLKKGSFYASRSLFFAGLYSRFNSLEKIDGKTVTKLEKDYFFKSLSEVDGLIREKYHHNPEVLAKMDGKPGFKMAMFFRYYYNYCAGLAINDNQENILNYQIFCSPAMGSCNRWLTERGLESWEKRSAHKIGKMLMDETAALFSC